MGFSFSLLFDEDYRLFYSISIMAHVLRARSAYPEVVKIILDTLQWLQNTIATWSMTTENYPKALKERLLHG